MIMLAQQKITRSCSMLLLVAFLCSAPAVLGAQTSKDSAVATGLLSDAKTESIQLEQDAMTLKSFTRSNLSWQAHAEKVNEIKDHVNKLGELAGKLNSARSTASPWQQEVIDRINPLLKELASSVESTINHLSQQSVKLQLPPYKDYAAANATLATDLAKLVSDFVDYGQAKNKAEEFERTLELPGK